MPTVGSLIVNVLANTAPLTAGLTKARAAVAAFAASSAVATAGVAAFGVALFKLHSANETIQRSMNHSLAIMGDVTRFQRNEMTKVAIETARVTIFSTSQVADAYYELGSANMSAQQAMEAMPSVAAFAMAGNFNLARATKLAAGALYGLQLNSKDNDKQLKNMRMIMDKLVRVTTLAQTNTENFAEALTKSSGALRAAGMDIDDGLPLLAAFARMNIEGAEAATALQIVLREFKHKAFENAEAFKRFGVAVFDTGGNMRKVSDIFRDLTKAIGHMSTAEKVATISAMGFQKKSMRFIELLSGQEEIMDEVEKKLKDYGGRMDEVAGKQMTDFQTALSNLKAEWDLLAVSTGAASRFMEDIVNWFAELIKWSNTVAEGGFITQWFGDITPMVAMLDVLHGMKVAVVTIFHSIKVFLATTMGGVALILGDLLKFAQWFDPAGFAGLDETIFALDHFVGQMHDISDEGKQAISDMWDVPPPSAGFREQRRKDAKEKARLEDLERRDALAARLAEGEKARAAQRGRLSGGGGWIGTGHGGAPSFSEVASGDIPWRQGQGYEWDMYGADRKPTGEKLGAGYAGQITPMTGATGSIWGETAGRREAVSAMETWGASVDAIVESESWMGRAGGLASRGLAWMGGAAGRATGVVPRAVQAGVAVAGQEEKFVEGTGVTGRETRISKAMELGTMEAFQAARGMTGDDPQKNVVLNTKGIWETLERIEVQNAENEDPESGHITGMG